VRGLLFVNKKKQKNFTLLLGSGQFACDPPRRGRTSRNTSTSQSVFASFCSQKEDFFLAFAES